MSTTTRTWIAASLLSVSALILTLNSHPVGFGGRAGIGMLILFINAWIIAVGERSIVSHGGLRIKRFPLSPRLLATEPGTYPQMLVMIAFIGVVTNSLQIAGVALVVVSVLYVRFLRMVAPFIIPVGAALTALLTMDEFHTLGDLVGTTKEWGLGLVWAGLAVVTLTGPIVRTDGSAPYKKVGWVVVLLAGIPAYALGLVLMTQTNFFLHPNLSPYGYDVLAIGLGVLLGGVLQSLIVSSLASQTGLVERDPETVPAVSGHRIGMGLMPLLMPLLAWRLLAWVPMDEASKSLATPAAWAGLMALLLIVPAVPAAALVAQGMDRADGRVDPKWSGRIALGLLAGWFVLGPDVLRLLYQPEGIGAALRGLFGLGGTMGPVSTPDTMGSLMLYGVSVTDLCRGVTLMLAASAALSVRYLRVAAAGEKSIGWKPLIMLVALQGGASWWLMPRVGPVGAPLAAALAAVTLLGVNLLGQLLKSMSDNEATAAPEVEERQVPTLV
jgi:hypothetical protein